MAAFQGAVACLYADLWNGQHQRDDEYRLALFVGWQAKLNAETTAYTTEGEVVGTGYAAGGIALTDRKVSDEGAISFAPPKWRHLSVRDVDTALLYNKTNGRAIAIFRMPATSATNGPFVINDRVAVAFPPPDGR